MLIKIYLILLSIGFNLGNPIFFSPCHRLSPDTSCQIDSLSSDTVSCVKVLIPTFLGNEQRNYYGNEAPSRLDVIWKLYLGEGETVISRKAGAKKWKGAGWTGQPLLVSEDSLLYLIQGAYDHNLKKIKAASGEIVWEYEFDDVVKGTGTIWVNQKADNLRDKYVILQGSRLGTGNFLDSKHIPSYRAISYFSGEELWRLDSKWMDSYSRDVDGSALIINDTYGFPLDLTELILKEKNLSINNREFENEMKVQKTRSKQASKITAEDWTLLKEENTEEFIGYDRLESDIYITRYRKIIVKGKEQYQLVFNFTPFYATAGGQVGDTGYIESEKEKIQIIDTISENELSIHLTKKLPDHPEEKFHAVVNKEKRQFTANNHSATHLLHQALRKILGNHIEQKGSLVTPDHFRFDFSHFQKVNDSELEKIETMVNSLIRENSEQKCYIIPMKEAQNKGAIALFGEKYNDIVRVIQFGESIELCGGTHVSATGQIGFFKIISESAVAAGIRRIEAITALKAEKYIRDQLGIINEIKNTFKSSRKILDQIKELITDNTKMSREIEALEKHRLKIIKKNLLSKVLEINGINFIAEVIEISSAGAMRDLAFQLKKEMKNLFLLTGAEINGKANLALMISDNLVKERGLDAGNIIDEIAKKINGGGGGQSFFATAGGKNPSGLNNAIIRAKEIVSEN